MRVAYKVGDDISTDVIYPGRYMATVLPSETIQYAFADDLAFNKKLNQGKVSNGSVVLAGKNFGCGSSREQAASCLRGYDIVVVAKGIARIFLQNCVNLGLQTIISPDIEASEDDDLEIKGGKIVNKTTGKSFEYLPLPQVRQVIVAAGGLIPYTRKKYLKKMNAE
jgi:3-isopropylmalate/(R)-2-methylmalate dehydratase small subunit